MWRLIVGLVGLSVIGAIFAGVYYSSEEVRALEGKTPTFNIAPGEVRTDFLEPGIEGGPILVTVTVHRGTVDLYLMDQEWAASLTQGGVLNLSRPFNDHKQWRVLALEGEHLFTVIGDGQTRYAMVFDNTDNYYNDTAPNGSASIDVRTRYWAEESQSLMLGYFAAVPSVALIAWTAWRTIQRERRRRQA